jgi:hypothetical protein
MRISSVERILCGNASTLQGFSLAQAIIFATVTVMPSNVILFALLLYLKCLAVRVISPNESKNLPDNSVKCEMRQVLRLMFPNQDNSRASRVPSFPALVVQRDPLLTGGIILQLAVVISSSRTPR